MKTILTVFIALFSLVLQAQDLYPQLADEMELEKDEVLQRKIKSVTLTTHKEGDHETQLQWIYFNLDGTVSECKGRVDHLKYSYAYDDRDGLRALMVVDLNPDDPDYDTTMRFFDHENNKITERFEPGSFRIEWYYKDSTYSILLEKRIISGGMESSRWKYSYEGDRLKKIVLTTDLTMDQRFYSREIFTYNQNGLLEKVASYSWDEIGDSTIYYYGDDEVLDSAHVGHLRGGGEGSVFQDWNDLVLYDQSGKWSAQYSFSKSGELHESWERTYSEGGLLISEKYDDLDNEDRNTVTIYSYEFYPD